jgi:hypothetical protein
VTPPPGVILSRADGEGSPVERRVVLVLALACALSRFLAMAKSLWDSDEVLFVHAMRDYDVTAHHPHPPGFPMLIALAKVARLLVGDDFRVLQSVSLIAGMLAFPAVFLFARAIGLRFDTAAIAGTLFAVFPNVWFFSGSAHSDVPSIVLATLAAALLLRGRYFAGTLLLAIAIGIRPQNALIGLAPFLIASRHRRVNEIAGALLIGLAVAGAAFGFAIQATGTLDGWLRALREHSDYVSRVDSFRNPDRPPLWRLLHPFFVKQYQAPAPSIVVTLFVIHSMVRSIRERSRSMLLNALTFAPFALFAWLMLQRFDVNRLAIGYAPMFAIFAADGIARTRWPRAIAGVIAAAFAVWTVPALNVVRTTVSPPVAAALAAKQQPGTLFAGITMTTFLDLLAPEKKYIRVMDDRALPLSDSRDAWLLAEITRTEPRGLVFRRERARLWNIVRRQFFEVKLEPVTRRAAFVEGWEEPEIEGSEEWRWTTGKAVALLPPRQGLLRMHFFAPHEGEVTISLNGQLLERFTAGGYVERDYEVQAARGENELVIDGPRLRFRFLGL